MGVSPATVPLLAEAARRSTLRATTARLALRTILLVAVALAAILILLPAALGAVATAALGAA
jgi:hypothetical protein